MPTAMDSAVIERLAVRSAADPADLTPSALPGLVLAELEWEPEQLPARTAFVVSGPDLPAGLADSGTEPGSGPGSGHDTGYEDRKSVV